MLHFNGENYGRAGAGNWASVVPMVLPHIAVGRFLLHRLCSVRTFGNVFLETGAGKENAAIGNILHIGDETVVPCRIQSCDADSQQFGGFLPGKQFFHCGSHSFRCILADGKADAQRSGYILHFFFGKFADIVTDAALIQGAQLLQHDHRGIFHTADHADVAVCGYL